MRRGTGRGGERRFFRKRRLGVIDHRAILYLHKLRLRAARAGKDPPRAVLRENDGIHRARAIRIAGERARAEARGIISEQADLAAGARAVGPISKTRLSYAA